MTSLGDNQKIAFMKKALRLAKRGAGFVSPNPMVGAVIVKNGNIIAEGYHHCCGQDHAEVDALKKLNFNAQGCSLFLNLEPCSHFGRTPPCADALIRSGIKAVYIGTSDPNPKVSGEGIRRLQAAGIHVETGICEKECLELNRIFFKHIVDKIPYVLVKAAISLDSKIAAASGDSGQNSGGISGPEAHRLVHRLRHDFDAILVGAGTVIKDDPLLTCRLPGRKTRNPLRIVLDARGQTPAEARLLDTSIAPTLIVSTSRSSQKWRKAIQAKGAELLLMESTDGLIDIRELLKNLGSRVASIMVEGGSEVISSFLRAEAVDRIMFFIAPLILGGEKIPVVGGPSADTLADGFKLEDVKFKRIGCDLLYEARPVFGR